MHGLLVGLKRIFCFGIVFIFFFFALVRSCFFQVVDSVRNISRESHGGSNDKLAEKLNTWSIKM